MSPVTIVIFSDVAQRLERVDERDWAAPPRAVNVRVQPAATSTATTKTTTDRRHA